VENLGISYKTFSHVLTDYLPHPFRRIKKSLLTVSGFSTGLGYVFAMESSDISEAQLVSESVNLTYVCTAGIMIEEAGGTCTFEAYLPSIT
jgi:hypothetical protein